MRAHFLKIEIYSWILLIIGVMAISAFYLGALIVYENYRWLIITFSFGGAIFLGAFILHDWRIGLFAFFIWFPFEDLARKYLGNALIIYGVKDIIVLMTYVSYFLARRRQNLEQSFKSTFMLPLLILFIWAIIESINPNVTHVLVPVVGLRMSFFYVPMVFLGYSLAKDEQWLKYFLVLSLVLGAVIAALGIAQGILGLDFLNPENAPGLRLYLIRRVPGIMADVPRSTSTFVNASRFAQYLFALFYLGLALSVYLHVRKPSQSSRLYLGTWLCWGVIVAALFLNGQRAAILWVTLSVLIIVIMFLTGNGHWKAYFPIMRVAAGVLVVFLLLNAWIPELFNAVSRFYITTLLPTSPYSDILQRQYGWTGVIRSLQSSLLGHGTGTQSLGQQYILGSNMHTPAVEGGYSTVAWEWGIVGLVLWLWWSLALMRDIWRIVASVKETPFYWFGVILGLYVFFVLFPWFYLGMYIYQNYVTQAFLWLFTGILFRLPDLAQANSSPQPQEMLNRSI